MYKNVPDIEAERRIAIELEAEKASELTRKIELAKPLTIEEKLLVKSQ